MSLIFQKKVLSEEVTKLEKEHSEMEQETKEMVTELGDTQHQKLTAGKAKKYMCVSGYMKF